MKTFHPESDVINSRIDGDEFVYTVMRNGAAHDVRVPKTAFAGIPEGPVGTPQRRAVLADWVKRA